MVSFERTSFLGSPPSGAGEWTSTCDPPTAGAGFPPMAGETFCVFFGGSSSDADDSSSAAGARVAGANALGSPTGAAIMNSNGRAIYRCDLKTTEMAAGRFSYWLSIMIFILGLNGSPLGTWRLGHLVGHLDTWTLGHTWTHLATLGHTLGHTLRAPSPCAGTPDQPGVPLERPGSTGTAGITLVRQAYPCVPACGGGDDDDGDCT